MDENKSMLLALLMFCSYNAICLAFFFYLNNVLYAIPYHSAKVYYLLYSIGYMATVTIVYGYTEEPTHANTS